MYSRREHLAFLKGLVRHPVKTGAIAPSSTNLALEILRYWPNRHDSTIVEYGPGTGSFTRVILSRLRGERFFAMELNQDFVAPLRRDGVDVYHGSADQLRWALNERHLARADLVVSGLPWAVFSEDLQNRILDTTVENLAPGGMFSTFAYIHSRWMPQAKRFSSLLQKKFHHVEISQIVWKNMPPAVIYHCCHDDISTTNGISDAESALAI